MATRILVIDDDRDLLELYGLILSDEGYDVHLCGDGTRAATLVPTLDPAVILIDGHIAAAPRGDRLWTVLTQDDHRCMARFLLCSADPRLVTEQEAFFTSIGGAVLSKPFNIDDLLTLVTRLSTPWLRPHAA